MNKSMVRLAPALAVACFGDAAPDSSECVLVQEADTDDGGELSSDEPSFDITELDDRRPWVPEFGPARLDRRSMQPRPPREGWNPIEAMRLARKNRRRRFGAGR